MRARFYDKIASLITSPVHGRSGELEALPPPPLRRQHPVLGEVGTCSLHERRGSPPKSAVSNKGGTEVLRVVTRQDSKEIARPFLHALLLRERRIASTAASMAPAWAARSLLVLASPSPRYECTERLQQIGSRHGAGLGLNPGLSASPPPPPRARPRPPRLALRSPHHCPGPSPRCALLSPNVFRRAAERPPRWTWAEKSRVGDARGPPHVRNRARALGRAELHGLEGAPLDDGPPPRRRRRRPGRGRLAGGAELLRPPPPPRCCCCRRRCCCSDPTRWPACTRARRDRRRGRTRSRTAGRAGGARRRRE